MTRIEWLCANIPQFRSAVGIHEESLASPIGGACPEAASVATARPALSRATQRELIRLAMSNAAPKSAMR